MKRIKKEPAIITNQSQFIENKDFCYNASSTNTQLNISKIAKQFNPFINILGILLLSILFTFLFQYGMYGLAKLLILLSHI